MIKATLLVTIGSGAALSNAVINVNDAIDGIMMPASWTAADLTFQVSLDGQTYGELYDVPISGVAVSNYQVVAPPAGAAIPLDVEVFAGWSFIKVRSGTALLPVVQGGNRALIISCMS